MSYHVAIGKDNFNYTYNMAGMFWSCIDGGIKSLHGKTGSQAAKMIGEGFDRLHREYASGAQFRAKYDAPNGWGSTDGGMIFLARIMAACHRNPRSKVWVS